MHHKVIMQHDTRDCGAACLATVLYFYKQKVPLSLVRTWCKADASGATLYGLTEAAKKFGLDANAVCGSSEELIDGIDKGEITFPFIAHIIADEERLHYIVVFSYKNGKFTVGDPGSGQSELTAENFFCQWTGSVLLLKPDVNFPVSVPQRHFLREALLLLQGQKKRLAAVLLLSIFIAGIGIAGSFIFEVLIDNYGLQTGYFVEEGTDDSETSGTNPSDIDIADNSESSSDLDEASTNNTESDNSESPEYESADAESGEESANNFFDNFMMALLVKIGELEEILANHSFTLMFIGISFLFILQAWIQYVRSRLILKVAKIVDIRLTLSYYTNIQNIQIEQLHTMQTGEYLSRVEDASAIRSAISTMMVTILLDAVMIIGSSVILIHYNAKMFLLSSIILFLFAVLIITFRSPLEKSNRLVMQRNAEIQSYFKESIDGIETIRANSNSAEVKNRLSEKFNRFIDAIINNSVLSVVQESIAGSVEMLGTVAVLWLGFSLVSQNVLTAGNVITFYALLSYFSTPVKNLVSLQPELQEAIIAADRLHDVLDMSPEEDISNANLPDNVTEWSARNITFRYGNHPTVLNNVSLSVHRGEKIALVGESGCGKTTFAKLFLRFFTPEEGLIQADGVSLSEYSLESLRKEIAYVSQDTFLFSDTLRNNLTIGLSHKISDEELFDVCCKCQLKDLIDSLPAGLDTPIAENGSNLSGGQRQRIAIARAILKEPQLLILDEATSSLDTVTENAIHNMLNNMTKNMACIIIAHRLATIKQCDKIFVMKNGNIEEEGAHNQLLTNHSYYYSLWNSQ